MRQGGNKKIEERLFIARKTDVFLKNGGIIKRLKESAAFGSKDSIYDVWNEFDYAMNDFSISAE